MFGGGLSCTTVANSALTVHDPGVHATARLTITGSRPALEAVQAYISDLTASVTWAGQGLKAFVRRVGPSSRPEQLLTVEFRIRTSGCG